MAEDSRPQDRFRRPGMAQKAIPENPVTVETQRRLVEAATKLVMHAQLAARGEAESVTEVTFDTPPDKEGAASRHYSVRPDGGDGILIESKSIVGQDRFRRNIRIGTDVTGPMPFQEGLSEEKGAAEVANDLEVELYIRQYGPTEPRE